MNTKKNSNEDVLKKTKLFLEKQEYKKALGEIQNFSNKEHPVFLYYLAFIKNNLNEKIEALKILNKLTNKETNFTEAYHLSAIINEDIKKNNEAEKIYEHLIKKNSNDWKANYNLGRLYEFFKNDSKKALEKYKRALEINSNNNFMWDAVGRLQKKLNYYSEALSTFTNITKKFPENPNNFRNLAKMQLETGLVDLSEETIKKITSIEEDQEALNILASCYQKQFNLSGAEIILKKILKFKLYNKEEDIAYRRLLLLKTYKEDYEADSLSLITKEYIKIFGNKDEKKRKIEIKNKRMRIGFVSSDFRKHSINNVIHSLFINRNKKKFKFCCYSSDNDQDKITKWYENKSDSWKNITSLNDKDASNLIISDNIDILIFIGGFTGSNRFLLSTYRSAPKQISFHPITSSNSKSLDYWLTDNVLNPDNINEKNSEKILRIKNLFNFSKPEDKFLPKINEPPMKKNNFISFGSFNNPTKISFKSLELWVQVLKSFEGSKLYLKYYNFLNNKKIKDKISSFFEKNGIQKNRIIFIESKNHELYLENYKKIDIGLDTFPYSGATTTFGAVCMGVPVLTLTGKNYISRQSASILHSIGLAEWVIQNKNDYIKTLKKLANLKEICNLRLNLRKKIRGSSLCNGIEFTKNFENALEKIS